MSTLDPSKLLCVSIAWDWMFKGVTSEGINREVSSILECARLNQYHKQQSLAIPEAALLFLAKENIAKHVQQIKGQASNSFFQPPVKQRISHNESDCVPDAKTVLRGILPGLTYVAHKHASAAKSSENWKPASGSHERVKINWKPNARENPDLFALDPYGSSDFFCRICMEELSNVYMHCDGCENLLVKDFNICVTCHSEGGYKSTHQMHPFDPKRVSTLNHTGDPKFERSRRCPCKNGRVCIHCEYCTGCSCKCHQRFTLHYRFMRVEKELRLLQQAESVVGSDVLPHSTETKARLFSLVSDILSPNDEFTIGGGTLPTEMTQPPQQELVTSRSYATNGKAADSIIIPSADDSGFKKPNKVATHTWNKETPTIQGEISDPGQKSNNTISIKKNCPIVSDFMKDPDKKIDDNPENINPDSLTIGSCVYALYRNCPYEATIIKRREKGGKLDFQVYYTGDKKTRYHWVALEKITNIISTAAAEESSKQKTSDLSHESTDGDDHQQASITVADKNGKHPVLNTGAEGTPGLNNTSPHLNNILDFAGVTEHCSMVPMETISIIPGSIPAATITRKQSKFADVNWEERCQSLVDNILSTVEPTSAYDMSPSALAFTAPRGEIGFSTEFSTVVLIQPDLVEFIAEAKSIEFFTAKDFANSLPKNSNVKKNTAHHLYRNFADCKEIGGPCLASKPCSIYYSRREIDIMNYFIIRNRDCRCAAKLIPYRPIHNIREMMQKLKDKGDWENENYGDMLVSTVGKILELES